MFIWVLGGILVIIFIVQGFVFLFVPLFGLWSFGFFVFNLIWKLEKIVWKQQQSDIEIKWLEIQLNYFILFFGCFSRKLANLSCALRDFFFFTCHSGLELVASHILTQPSTTVLYLSHMRQIFNCYSEKNFRTNDRNILKTLPGLVLTCASLVRARAQRPLASSP